MNRLLSRVLRTLRTIVLAVEGRFDDRYLAPDVPMSTRVSHGNWLHHLRHLANEPGLRVLEIGSREVTARSQARSIFERAEYMGFDYYPGDNVDVVGDAHKLSSYFDREEGFDLVYSSASFEHFAMPWVVATEIAKVLKVGGLVFVETHFSYGSHERPWHFFQFSDMALRVLFSGALGFECLESGLSNPLVARFSSLADPYLRLRPVPGLYCHSEYLGRKVREVEGFDWEDLDVAALVGNTHYPLRP
jgi:SAM-dependent methyltransferase